MTDATDIAFNVLKRACLRAVEGEVHGSRLPPERAEETKKCIDAAFIIARAIFDDFQAIAKAQDAIAKALAKG